MFRVLWAKKSLIVFLVLIVAFVPAAIIKPAQMMTKSVVTALGIDKLSTGEYQISGHVVENKFNPTGAVEKVVFASAIGATVEEATVNLGASMGAPVGLKHCGVLLIGSSMQDENVALIFEQFIKNGDLSNNSFVVYTEGSAVEMLEATVGNNKILHKVLDYNRREVFSKKSNIDVFYKDYLESKSQSFIAVLNVGSDGIVENKGIGAIFKNGKFSHLLSKEQVQQSAKHSAGGFGGNFQEEIIDALIPAI